MGDAERALFDDSLGRADLDESQIADLQRQIEHSGAVESVEASISRHTNQALDALRAAPLHTETVEELEVLARRLTERSS
jgi:geranylgeranyl diphosphate synthase type I